MPFNTALSAGDYINLRGDGSNAPAYRVKTFVSASANTQVYTARINQTTFFNSAAFITYDGGVGTLADVRIDQTIVISRTNDPTAFYWRGRVRQTPTSTVLFINETGADFADDDYIFILNDYDVHIKLARYGSVSGSAGSQVLLDFNRPFAPPSAATPQAQQLPPLISDHQAVYAAMVDDGTSLMTVVLAPTVTAAQNGTTISTYFWEVEDGTITVGTDADKDITVTFPVGERYIHLTATDSAGNALTRHIWVLAHDKGVNHPNAVLALGDTLNISCEIPLSPNEGASEGWESEVTAFAGVDTMLDRTRMVIWKHDEQYNGAAATVWDNNIIFIGRMSSESDTTTIDEKGEPIASATFNLESGLAQIARIHSPPIEMNNNAATSDLSLLIDRLTMWRTIWAELTLYNTCGSNFPVSFDDLTNAYELRNEAGTVSQGGDPLTDVADFAQSISACCEQAQDGRTEIVRRAIMLPDSDRNSLVTVADLTTSDMVEEIAIEHPQLLSLKSVKANGYTYNSSTNVVELSISIAPRGAPEEPVAEDSLPRQILQSNQTAEQARDELSQRCGDMIATLQQPDTIRLPLVDGWNGLTPAVDQWYTITLPADLNVRGISYDTSTRWWLQAIEITPLVIQGSAPVTATFIKEPDEHPSGENRPLPLLDTGLYGVASTFTELTPLDSIAPVPFEGFNFDLVDGGFTQDTDGPEPGAGTWGIGTGWSETCEAGPAQLINISKTFTEVQTVTKITLQYDASGTANTTDLNGIFIKQNANSAWERVHTFSTVNSSTVLVEKELDNVPAIAVRVLVYADSTACSGSVDLKQFSVETLAVDVPVLLETITVGVTALVTATSTTVLQSGSTYIVRSIGLATYNSGSGTIPDFDSRYRQGPSAGLWSIGAPPIGLAIDSIYAGAPDNDTLDLDTHTYDYTIVGAGSTIDLGCFDTNYLDNAGSWAIEIYLT